MMLVRIVGVTRYSKDYLFFLVEKKDGNEYEIPAQYLRIIQPQIVISHLLYNAQKYPVSLSNKYFLRGASDQLSTRYYMLKKTISSRTQLVDRNGVSYKTQLLEIDNNGGSLYYEELYENEDDFPRTLLNESFYYSSSAKVSHYQNDYDDPVSQETDQVLQNSDFLTETLMYCLDFEDYINAGPKNQRTLHRYKVSHHFLESYDLH